MLNGMQLLNSDANLNCDWALFVFRLVNHSPLET